MTTDEEMEPILNVPFNFSVNCCSGIVGGIGKQCECWRCRKARGLGPDEELAARISDEAREAHQRDIRQFLDSRT